MNGLDVTINSSDGTSMKAPWRINTPQMLEEILLNPGTGIFRVPFTMLARTLALVAERAIELDDLEMHALMIRLALYNDCTPDKEGFEDVDKYMMDVYRGKKPDPAKLRAKKENNALKVMLDDMTDDERHELLSNYCSHCGSDNPFCRCWDDS